MLSPLSNRSLSKTSTGALSNLTNEVPAAHICGMIAENREKNENDFFHVTSLLDLEAFDVYHSH